MRSLSGWSSMARNTSTRALGPIAPSSKLYPNAKLLLASDLIGRVSLYRATRRYSILQRPCVPVASYKGKEKR